ncbi:MAG: DUF2167 domain-containing protein [Paludibacteraceae bacterium]|nr:DUF2167 domain-containing protein [Paludibacteraceae bacterium]
MKSFSKTILLFIASILFLALPTTMFSQEDSTSIDTTAIDTTLNNELMAYLQKIFNDTINGAKGDVHLPEGNATIHVPQGMMFLDSAQAHHLLEDYWGNQKDEDILGIIVADSCRIFNEIGIAYIVYFDNCGFIKDDDASEIDYNDLLKDIQESANEANEERKELGLSTYEIVGWADAPHYDNVKKVLHWAKQLRFTSEDNEPHDVLNYDIRILGKDGYCILQAVADMEDLSNVKSMSEALVNSVEFDNGYAYKDFDPKKDKIAEWTIGGLIAGNILAKAGVFTKLGLLLAKGWKLIVIAIVAIAAFFKKLFKKEDKAPEAVTPTSESEAKKEEEN